MNYDSVFSSTIEIILQSSINMVAEIKIIVTCAFFFKKEKTPVSVSSDAHNLILLK
jgi:hypothetical protein